MKAVIFDFDGTLTQKKNHLWKRIWKELGYDVGAESYYINLYNKFLNNEISHKEWCDLTCDAFMQKGFSREHFDEMIKEISLINGAADLIKQLSEQNIDVRVVSGNISYVIKKVLGETANYVNEIKANEFLFDKNGVIHKIVGTKYDYEGKAKYIEELCKKNGYQPQEVLFVGNSMNDEFAYKSGVKTLCVNPDKTNPDNQTIWHKVLYTNNLLDLKNEIL